MQEIPIPDATFLDGEANTYPGELTQASPKKISFMVPFVSAPMPLGLQSRVCGAQDSDHNLCEGKVSTKSQALTIVLISDDVCH